MIEVLSKPYRLMKKSRVDMMGNMGSMNTPDQVIYIDESLPAEQFEETVLHEVIHIVDHELKLGLEEDTVSRLAVGLYSAGCRVKND